MERYRNQIALQSVGKSGQQKLQGAAVLVIGAGGLGCPALTYLSGAGIGTLGIVDADKVSLENLHRQTLYNEEDVGEMKVAVVARELAERNSEVIVKVYAHSITSENAENIVSEYDLVLDCTDNFAARYIINDACVSMDKPWIYAALHGHQGQLCLFNYQGSGTYRCLFPETDQREEELGCSDVGILPTTSGMLGVMQATEAIKVILNHPNKLVETLLTIDARNYSIQKMTFKRKRETEADEVDLFEEEIVFTSDMLQENYEIDALPSDLASCIVIDIRQPFEIEMNPFPDAAIVDPTDVESFIRNESSTKQVILLCAIGNRSLILSEHLREKGLLTYSLKGGAVSLKNKMVYE